MWRIVHHHIKARLTKGHAPIIPYNIGAKAGVDVQPNHRPWASPPKASSVDRGIEDLLRSLMGIEIQQQFQQLAVFPFPYGGEATIWSCHGDYHFLDTRRR